MGRLCAFLSESPNPVAELAATTALYAPQWPGIKCPRTIFHITVRCRRRRRTWLGCGGQRRKGEAGGRGAHRFGAIQRRQDVLHLARAVVPPPRLRAKSVSISASLHPSYGNACWAPPVRTGLEKTLQNPARTPYFPSGQEHDPKALFSGDPWETSNLGMSR